MIREYLRKQEHEDLRVEQLKFRLEAALEASLIGSQTRPSFAEGVMTENFTQKALYVKTLCSLAILT